MDLKMVNFLLGQRGGYTKYTCFLFYWNSRAKDEHWMKDEGSARNSLAPGEKSIIYSPVVDAKKIIVPQFI